MEYCINFLKLLFITTIFITSIKAKDIEFSILELTEIAQKIYQNECGSKLEKLIFWSNRENFASMGIGHFIWYPEGTEKKFDESFPKLLDFMTHHGIQLPNWLTEHKHNPWNNKEEMLKDPRINELRDFLQKSISIQTLFLAKRINKALPKILNATKPNRHDKIIKTFNSIASQEDGYYLLIDYVNFKGEGIKKSERYKNQGWGLLQVLECIKDDKTPKSEFARCAKKILKQRVENAPKELNEHKWLKGWLNRIDTYY